MKTSEKAKAKPVEPEKCVYCGRMTTSRDYILNPGAGHELPCCGTECYESAQAFVARDKRFRMPFYLVLTVLVVANLIFFALMPDTRWKYLPMLGIGTMAAVFPYVFARYDRYQAMGLKKTTAVVRVAAAAFAVFAAALIFTY